MANESNVIEPTVENFKAAFPELANYPTASINIALVKATFFISNRRNQVIKDNVRGYAILLMAAHLLSLSNYAAMSGSVGGGASPFLQTSAKVGEVSVGQAVPSDYDSFKAWILSTPRGRELNALFTMHNAVGLYKFGSFQRKFLDNML